MDMPSVPFTIDQVYQGLATLHGRARMTPAGLTLEFEVRDAFVGAVKSGVQQVDIGFDDLAGLDLQTGWVRTRLLIRTASMRAPAAVPGDHQRGILLSVRRADRAAAKSLVSALLLRQSERALEKLGRGADIAV